MKFVKISAGEDGESNLTDLTWPMQEGDFTPPSPAGYSVTDTLPADGVLMMRHPAGYEDEWHCAPTVVLGTVLRGAVEIKSSDGDVRLLSPGDQFVAADLTGAGHKIEEVNGEAYDLALVMLATEPEALVRSAR